MTRDLYQETADALGITRDAAKRRIIAEQYGAPTPGCPPVAYLWEPGHMIRTPSGSAVVVGHLDRYSLRTVTRDGNSMVVPTSAAGEPPQEAPCRRAPPPLPLPRGVGGTEAGDRRSVARRMPASASAPAAPPTVVGWDGSVPRQAQVWERRSDGTVRVVLREGLAYEDGSVEKIHPTIRQAKDLTRAAKPPSAQQSLL